MIKHTGFKNTPIVTSGGIVHFDENGIGKSSSKRAEEILLKLEGFTEIKEKKEPKESPEIKDESDNKQAPVKKTTRRRTTKKVEDKETEK